MPLYSGCLIPDSVWNFFSTEPGFSTEQLKRAIDQRKAINPFYNFGVFQMLDSFRGGFDLLKYYRDTPELSVDALLQYDEYSVRDFICHDRPDYLFHHWLLQHQLNMPKQLVGSSRWSQITSLCNTSGIAYLNRKIADLPPSEWKAKLEEIVNDIPNLEYDKEKVLADCLVGVHQVTWNTIETRFLEYKKIEAGLATSVGEVTALPFQMSKILAERQLTSDDLAALPPHLAQAVSGLSLFNTERARKNNTVMMNWTGQVERRQDYRFIPKQEGSVISRIDIRINPEARWVSISVLTSQMDMYKRILEAGAQCVSAGKTDPYYFNSSYMCFKTISKQAQERLLSQCSATFLNSSLHHTVYWKEGEPGPHVEVIHETIAVLAQCDPTIAEISTYMNQELAEEQASQRLRERHR